MGGAALDWMFGLAMRSSASCESRLDAEGLAGRSAVGAAVGIGVEIAVRCGGGPATAMNIRVSMLTSFFLPIFISFSCYTLCSRFESLM